MAEPFTLEWGEVKVSINATQERLANPRPVLRAFSRILTKDVRENIAAGGVGWPPYAASTLKRMESTGTSQISKRGTVRANRVARTVSAMKTLERKIRAEGWTKDNRKKYDRLAKRLKNYAKAEDRAQGKSTGARKIGKRQSEKRKLLQGMPGTIRASINGNVLSTYSAANEIGKAHNDGEGVEPERQFLPPPNMPRHLETLGDMMESDLGQAWETGKGR